MSADNVVVIIKERDGKLRGYHRGMSMYAEGQYIEGLCPFCSDDPSKFSPIFECEGCHGSGHYIPPEEDSIFEVDTIEQAVHAYNKWYKEMEDSDEFGMFIVEYGFRFEGLEPNAETIQALDETEIYLSAKENLEYVVNRICNTNEGYKLVNCTPEMIKEKVQEVLANLNKISNVKIFDSAEALLEDLDQPNDTELLDFLQELTDKALYSGKVVCRDSTTGRGWRLHETSRNDAVSSVRQAIINYMKQAIKEE